ncbi:MAG: STAS domain-containing protein [Bryobacteraceae bacterium]
MTIEASHIGETTVIRVLDPRIANDTANALKSEIGKHVKLGATHIVLDLTAVTFMDNSGLGALVAILKMIGKRGDLIVAGAQETVRTLFRVTRMEKVFPSYLTVEEALEALTPGTRTKG